ncbi:MAG: hypothetical protein HKN91_16785 [Acidimicrobiia bacterium]|nr:hypothetical protein [Acidimicrobiia bacterium]
MTLNAALRWSLGHADRSIRPGVDALIRDSTRLGLAGALRAAEGPAAVLLNALARPVSTGAAIGPVLAGLRDRLESEYVAGIEERLERLPVKLVLPLALLMLPGLLLMIVAPALINSLSRLG